MHLSFNTKMLLFAGTLFGRFWKKHIVRRSTTSSTPGGTRHLEVGRSSYEDRKIREQKWDPQGTFGANDFRRKKRLHHCSQKAQIAEKHIWVARNRDRTKSDPGHANRGKMAPATGL